MQAIIRTVLGDIDAAALGFAQCHEHIFLEKGPSFELNPALRMDDYARSLAELKAYKAAGGNAVLDAQPGECGRMPESLVRASRESGVHIVAVSGFHKPEFYFPDAFALTAGEDDLASRFIAEIAEGVECEGGPCCAGVVKAAMSECGIDSGARSRRLFEAAAEAAFVTGAPVLIHTEKGADAMEALRFFTDRGVGANRLIFCHLDRTRYDLEFHLDMLGAGVFLCYDSINRLKHLTHGEELALIKAMLERGCREQLLLSLDTTSQRLRAYGADMGLDYILTTFKPMLLKAGVSEEDFSAMMTKNAARALRMRAFS